MVDKLQPSEVQNYSNLISAPEIIISDIGGVHVIFILNFTAAPDFVAKLFDFNHTHTCFELHYVAEGYTEQLIDNGRKLRLEEGDLCLIPPHMLHKGLPVPPTSIAYAVNFTIIPLTNEEQTEHTPYAFYKTLFSGANELLVFQNEEIGHCIKKIFESHHTNPLPASKTKLYLSLIFEEVASLLNSMTPQAIEPPVSHPTQEHIDTYRKWMIDAYIANYYMFKNHVENLAYILNLSPRQTRRVVKTLTDETLQTLILKQRMSVAYEKIKYTNLPLTQISEIAGYSSYPGFYIAFCKHFDFSPEELRNSHTGSV